MNFQIQEKPRKYYILLSTKKPEIISVHGTPLSTSSLEKLPVVIMHSQLKFENHITESCLKLNKKTRKALCHISSFTSIKKRRKLMKTFIQSQFNYFLLIEIPHSGTLNNKISPFHERALKTFYSDYKSSFN